MMRRSGKKPPFRVQILCETAIEYFRSIKLSIRHYASQTGCLKIVDNWFTDTLYNPAAELTFRPPQELLLSLKENLRQTRIDGIVAQVKTREMADLLWGLSIPVVEINDFIIDSPFPIVTQDWNAIGRKAAEHLMSCRGAAFGTWGIKDMHYSLMLKNAFRETISARLPKAPFFDMDGESILVENGIPLIRRMEKWLKKIPLPLGLFTVTETIGLHLMQAAQNIGLRIPDDVAILTSGADPYWINFGDIPLSSIQYNPNKVGIEAATLIEKMITQGVRTAPDCHVEGSELFVRRSTDVLFIKDDVISKAIAYIRANVSKNVYVADVAKAAGISVSSLYPRFKKALGHSVHQEIRNARINHVQMLLRTSNLQLAEIAELCDFHDAPAMSTLFRRITGQTPAKYRALFRQS